MLNHIRAFALIESLEFQDVPLIDRDLTVLSSFTQLKSLSVVNANLTDKGLRALDSVKNLTFVELGAESGGANCGFMEITDAGVVHFCSMRNLVYLNLSGFPKLSDSCIPLLSTIPKLASLRIEGSVISAEGAERLHAMCPRLESLNISN